MGPFYLQGEAEVFLGADAHGVALGVPVGHGEGAAVVPPQGPLEARPAGRRPKLGDSDLARRVAGYNLIGQMT